MIYFAHFLFYYKDVYAFTLLKEKEKYVLLKTESE